VQLFIKLVNNNKNMNLRTLESDTRMRFFLANNPMGELVKVISKECKRIESKKRKVTVK
jgi:hypothetical protein